MISLRSEKETAGLKVAFLEKRIHVLEQYKTSSAKLSAANKSLVEGESELIEKIGKTTSPSKTQQPLKTRSTKSKQDNKEMELLVESLKRVIEKQRA